MDILRVWYSGCGVVAWLHRTSLRQPASACKLAHRTDSLWNSVSNLTSNPAGHHKCAYLSLDFNTFTRRIIHYLVTSNFHLISCGRHSWRVWNDSSLITVTPDWYTTGIIPILELLNFNRGCHREFAVRTACGFAKTVFTSLRSESYTDLYSRYKAIFRRHI